MTNRAVPKQHPDSVQHRFQIADELGRVSFPQYAYTGSIPRSQNDKLYEVVSVDDFGAVGNSDGTAGVGTEDGPSIRLATAELIANGGGILRFGRGKLYRVFSDFDTTPLGSFSAVDGIMFDFNGAQLVCDRSFSGAQVVKAFTFNGCENINLGSPRMTCTFPEITSDQASRGFEFAYFSVANANIRADVTTALYTRVVYSFYGNTADVDANVNRNIDIGLIDTYRCAYPIVSNVGVRGLRARIHSELATRSFFPAGGWDMDVDVVSKDHLGDADCSISSQNEYGADGLRLSYQNTESSVSDGSTAGVVIKFHEGDSYAVTHRHIDIKINFQGPQGASRGAPLSVQKYLTNGSFDDTDRGHVLEDVTVSGIIRGGTSATAQGSVAVCSGGTWGSGEYVRNITFRNLRLDGTLSNPTFNLASLQDAALFQNVYCPNKMNVYGNSTNPITLISVKCDDSITNSTGDTSRQDYINCSIASASAQATDSAKTFINTDIAGTVYNRLRGNKILVSSLGPFIYALNGTPEGSLAAPVGSIAMRADGGASTSLYVKESGTGNTGWVAK